MATQLKFPEPNAVQLRLPYYFQPTPEEIRQLLDMLDELAAEAQENGDYFDD